jgi:hypothetical protein
VTDDESNTLKFNKNNNVEEDSVEKSKLWLKTYVSTGNSQREENGLGETLCGQQKEKTDKIPKKTCIGFFIYLFFFF